MNRFLPLKRSLNSLNRLFSINKFDNNFQTNQLRLSSKYVLFDDTEDFESKLKANKGTVENIDHLRRLVHNYIQKYQIYDPKHKNNVEIVSRVKKVAEELNQNPNKMNDRLYSMLMEFFTDIGDLESALDMKNRVSQGFLLDSFKIFNLATLLVKSDKTNAAIDLIESQKPLYWNKSKHFRDKRQDFKLKRDKSINSLLNAMIDKQINTEVIKRMFDLCVQIIPTEVNKTIVSPLIRMHLVKNDLTQAFNQYLFCAHNYSVCQFTLELMIAIIESKDNQKLQTIVKKSTEIIGASNTALELCVAYLYSDLEVEARQQFSKVSQTQQKTVEIFCKKLIYDNKFNQLKTFLQLIQKTNGIEISQLFEFCINFYLNSGQKERALDLIRFRTEQNIEPTNQTNKNTV